MLKRKRLREKGKLSFTKFFQKFAEGDRVAIVRELSRTASFPKRMQGRTGKVVKTQGKSYVVEIKDYNLPKRYIVHPVHLKRIK